MKKSQKRAVILWLAGVLAVSLVGCGKAGDDGAASKSGDGSGDSEAMGRYVETMIDVDTGEIMDLQELSDGRLVLLEDGAEGRWTSEDGGVTWKPDALPGWDEFVHGKYVGGNIVGGHYIYDMKAAPDGSVAILYRSYESMGVEEETGDGEEESADDKAEENNTIKDIPEIDAGIWLIPAQGEEKQIELPDEELPRCLCFSEDGSRFFAATFGEKIYEIDREAGTAKFFLQADFTPDVFCVWENYMALKDELSGVAMYQLDTSEQIEDNVITNFVKENCMVNDQTKDHVSESTYSIFPAEEEALYLVCSKGVYRHVIGGTVMEQVINGGLTSLIDPMKHVVKMIRTAAEGFIAAFAEGKLSAFVYDPNISTVLSQSFTAYSLTESDILRQAIIRYQGEHPDVYVEYKVGMDEDGGTTREDAVKKLNTEIMAGKGPDFLLLDGLPAHSYEEKGVLADLTPYLAELEKEEKLLANIKESFTKDGKICMMPAAVTLSMYMTDQEKMTNVSDLSSLADITERLRSEHPGEGIMETYSQEMLIDNLMPVSAPLWFTEAGQLNEEELTTYLKQAKRIYAACMEGLPEKLLKQYQQREKDWVTSSHEVSAYNDLQGGAIQIVAGNEKMTLGELKNAYNYAFVNSINKEWNGENGRNCRVALTPGSAKDSFRPYALMGINAASEKTELASGLLREALSGEMQKLIYPTGFPVNEAALKIYLASMGGMLSDTDKPGEPCAGYGLTNDDGTVIVVSICVPTEQETQELYDILSSVRTPYLSDAVVEDAVREAGQKYLDGKCSLEDAVELVQEKIAIYMAE
ncbi:MAG: hypothetical protein K2O59_17080 [Lachnospiraceae bacterium]|nr:hypothetical protein [Lachnospiraceae bacterium]